MVQKEIEQLREAMGELSNSAQGLAKQRDDARAALSRAKGMLRRIAPVRFRFLTAEKSLSFLFSVGVFFILMFCGHFFFFVGARWFSSLLSFEQFIRSSLLKSLYKVCAIMQV